MYECPNCAANLQFSIAKQMLYCEHCETTIDPYAFHKEKDAEETVDTYEVTIFSCPQCGGEILSEDNTAATFCSFCGSATILDSRISRERRPAYIIPFMKTKRDCERSYAKMMKRAFFAPKELKDKSHIEKFRGIYMPYWVYSFEKNGPASFSGSRSYRRGDYVYTKHYMLECDVEESYKGLAYDASASFSDNLSNAIAPFDLKKGKPFAPTFLSGFYADTSDVESRVYETEAENMIIEDACKRIARQPGCGKYHVNDSTHRSSLRNAVRPTRCKAELAMLPVWFLSYRNGDRVSYAVVNGQTGEAAGDLPVDIKKYVIGSVALAVPLFLLLNLFFTIRPTSILWIAAALALVCTIISNVQLSRIYIRESGEDDKGFMYAKRHGTMKETKVPKETLAQEMAAGREREKERRIKQQEKNSSSNGVGRTILFVIGIILLSRVVTHVLPTILINAVKTTTYSFDLMPIIGGIFLILFLGSFFLPIFFAVRRQVKEAKGKEKPSRKVGFKDKFPTLVKPLGAIVLAVLIQIVNPVRDEFYYIGAFVCMGAVLWALMDIIKQHNVLTTRKLPQFNKRGGDENA